MDLLLMMIASMVVGVILDIGLNVRWPFLYWGLGAAPFLIYGLIT